MWSQESELGSEQPRCELVINEQTILFWNKQLHCTRRGNYSRWLEFISTRCNWCIMKSEPHAPYASGTPRQLWCYARKPGQYLHQCWNIWLLDKLAGISCAQTNLFSSPQWQPGPGWPRGRAVGDRTRSNTMKKKWWRDGSSPTQNHQGAGVRRIQVKISEGDLYSYSFIRARVFLPWTTFCPHRAFSDLTAQAREHKRSLWRGSITRT